MSTNRLRAIMEKTGSTSDPDTKPGKDTTVPADFLSAEIAELTGDANPAAHEASGLRDLPEHIIQMLIRVRRRMAAALPAGAVVKLMPMSKSSQQMFKDATGQTIGTESSQYYAGAEFRIDNVPGMTAEKMEKIYKTAFAAEDSDAIPPSVTVMAQVKSESHEDFIPPKSDTPFSLKALTELAREVNTLNDEIGELLDSDAKNNDQMRETLQEWFNADTKIEILYEMSAMGDEKQREALQAFMMLVKMGCPQDEMFDKSWDCVCAMCADVNRVKREVIQRIKDLKANS